ncbi:hypothetical protein V8E36_002948, partial [Tilletia maclaganii]
MPLTSGLLGQRQLYGRFSHRPCSTGSLAWSADCRSFHHHDSFRLTSVVLLLTTEIWSTLMRNSNARESHTMQSVHTPQHPPRPLPGSQSTQAILVHARDWEQLLPNRPVGDGDRCRRTEGGEASQLRHRRLHGPSRERPRLVGCPVRATTIGCLGPSVHFDRHRCCGHTRRSDPRPRRPHGTRHHDSGAISTLSRRIASVAGPSRAHQRPASSESLL